MRSKIFNYQYSKPAIKMHPMMKLLLSVSLVILLASCNHPKQVVVHKDVSYTCSMHPQVMEPHPGKCPICGMALIEAKHDSDAASGEVILSAQQIQLGNIHTDTLRNSSIEEETILTATLNYDQQKLSSISSRVTGRIEKLYHKNVGELIKKGEALMDIYSEGLNAAKEEYLLALEREKKLSGALVDFGQVVNSAKAKLLLSGMAEAQINESAASNKATATTTFFSNESGYITELDVQEGDYVNEGGLIVQLAGLSTLWAEAQAYTSQFSMLDTKGSILIKAAGINKEIRGTPVFINPEISPDKRLNLIRVTIPNEGGLLKPGMPVSMVLKSAKHQGIFLPADAVLQNTGGASVWVQKSETGFKNKMVTTGLEGNGKIEILSGLGQGDVVVISGAYLINSEYIFRHGASPMAGMKM